MSSEKYIGMDVHQATISVAVRDSQGKLLMESILETKGATIPEFLAGLRGTLFVTFERIRLSQVSKWAEGNTREGPAGVTKRQRIRALLENRMSESVPLTGSQSSL